MAIVGVPLEKDVKEQLRIREQTYANAQNPSGNILGEKTAERLLTQNRTSWVRLASSINLEIPDNTFLSPEEKADYQARIDELVSNLGQSNVNIAGDGLARGLVFYSIGTAYDNVNGQFTDIGIYQTNNEGTVLVDENGDPIPYTGVDWLKRGIVTDGSKWNKGAYGFGGTEFGLRPAPALQGVSMDYYNNGALAKAEIDLVVYSPEQLAMVELLYLRPGYTILLELGHERWINNQSELDIMSFTRTAAYNTFFTKGKTTRSIQNAIISGRSSTAYNYEGFLGTVTNFNWTFNGDGSYNVKIKAVTVGSVIESLKINKSGGGSLSPDTSYITYLRQIFNTDDQNFIEQLYYKRKNTVLHGHFWNLTDAFLQDPNGPRPQRINTLGRTIISAAAGVVGQALIPIPGAGWAIGVGTYAMLTGGDQGKLYTLDAATLTSLFGKMPGTQYDAEALCILFKTNESNNSGAAQYYLTLGRLLNLINKAAGVYETGQTQPLFIVEDSYVPNTGSMADQEPTVPMLTFPGQLSSDPTVCVIPIDGFPDANAIEYYREAPDRIKSLDFNQYWIWMQAQLDQTSNPVLFKHTKNPYVGNLLSIYVNTNFVMGLLEQTRDESGKVNYIDLIQNILKGINTSLGGVNDLRAIFDEDSRKLTLIDQACYYTAPVVQDADLVSYGFETDTNGKLSRGSLLRSLSFSSELSNEYAAQIAIGAQANGNQIGVNATAFSEFNKGLVDRIIPEKLTSVESTTNKSAENKIADIIQTTSKVVFKLYQDLQITEESIPTLSSLNTDYAQFLVGFGTRTLKAIPPPFIIPFNLKLSMEGISGIKLFQAFTLSDTVLPYAYKGRVRFLIKNIRNTVTENQWVTELETMTVPYGKENAKDYTPTNAVVSFKQGITPYDSNFITILGQAYQVTHAGGPFGLPEGPDDVIARQLNRGGILPAMTNKQKFATLNCAPITEVSGFRVNSQVTERRNGIPHGGLDIKTRAGTEVYLKEDAKLVYAGTGVQGYGCVLALELPQSFGQVIVLGHLNFHYLGNKNPGDIIPAGTKIALTGGGQSAPVRFRGSSTGPHLHVDARRGSTLANMKEGVCPNLAVLAIRLQTPSS